VISESPERGELVRANAGMKLALKTRIVVCSPMRITGSIETGQGNLKTKGGQKMNRKAGFLLLVLVFCSSAASAAVIDSIVGQVSPADYQA